MSMLSHIREIERVFICDAGDWDAPVIRSRQRRLDNCRFDAAIAHEARRKGATADPHRPRGLGTLFKKLGRGPRHVTEAGGETYARQDPDDPRAGPARHVRRGAGGRDASTTRSACSPTNATGATSSPSPGTSRPWKAATRSATCWPACLAAREAANWQVAEGEAATEAGGITEGWIIFETGGRARLRPHPPARTARSGRC